LKKLLFILSFFFISNLYSQVGKSFEVNKQLYLKGNSIVIGNNTIGEHPTNAFDDINTPNDKVKMQYIDVDNDSNTFSSSSASILENRKGSQVAYAGLYWSGLYPFQSGVIRPSGNRMVHKAKGIRDTIVNTIKLRLPESNTYLDIEGTVIYDSFMALGFENNKPYVCYAEVTNALKELTTLSGEYTVANVRATEGFISGGSAGGWLLYVVYADETQSPRYFTTYNGLVEVNKKAVEIPFADFKTKEQGDITSNIVLASLEGDTKIRTDDCAIFSDTEQMYVSLHNQLRAQKNFFNSSITSFDAEMLDRNPASKNTLGFDLLKFKLPYGSIKNNTTSSKLRFYAKADRFYLFFTAFETEISEDFLTEKLTKKPTEIIIATAKTIKEEPSITEAIVNAEISSVQEEIKKEIKESPVKTNVKLTTVKKIDKPKVLSVAKNETIEVDDRARIINRPSMPAQGMIQGFYIVTNVFKNRDNAIRWKEQMNAKGHNARTFTNSDTQLMYVYVESDTNLTKLLERKNILDKLDYLEGIWIARLNFE
jgi:hypothetical protein